jgi:hypothetical protein
MAGNGLFFSCSFFHPSILTTFTSATHKHDDGSINHD